MEPPPSGPPTPAEEEPLLGLVPPVQGPYEPGAEEGPRRALLALGARSTQGSQLPEEELARVLAAVPGAPGAPARGGGSALACTAHLAKAILGVGITALPYCFSLLGALPSGALLAAMAALTLLSTRCLVLGAEATGRHDYTAVLLSTLGRRAAIALDVAMVLNCWGMLVVYQVVVADVLDSPELRSAVPPPVAGLLGDRPAVMALVAALVLAPLLSFKRLTRTTAASMLGVGAIALWTLTTLGLAAALLARGQAARPPLWPDWRRLHGPWHQVALRVASVVPVVLTAFMCQMSFYAVVRELRPEPTPRAMTAAAAAAVGGCLLLFVSLSVASQAVFDGGIEHNVLKNFTAAALDPPLAPWGARAVALTVRLGYLVSIIATFPLQMKPLLDSLFWLRRPGLSYATLQAAVPRGLTYRLYSYGALALATVAAAALPSVWLPLQVVGATAGSAIAFVLPGLLRLELEGRRRSWGSAGAVLLVALGAAQFLTSMLAVIMEV